MEDRWPVYVSVKETSPALQFGNKFERQFEGSPNWEANGTWAEEQRNITLEEALDKARAWEAAGGQATNMTAN